jgi:hypothetical protein
MRGGGGGGGVGEWTDTTYVALRFVVAAGGIAFCGSREEAVELVASRGGVRWESADQPVDGVGASRASCGRNGPPWQMGGSCVYRYEADFGER